MNVQVEDNIPDEVPEELEQEARDLGWVPLDEFRGPKDRWIPADKFVDKGRHIVPIMRERMNALQQKLLTRDKELDTLRETVENSNKAIEALEKHFNENTKRLVTEAKKDLLAKIKDARDSGDVDAEFELLEQLDTVKKAEADAKSDNKENKKDTPPPKVEKQPEWAVEWQSENPWYGTDKRLSKAMDRTCEDLRDNGETSVGKEFLDKAAKLMQKRIKYMEKFTEKDDDGDEDRPSGKVESGSTGRREGGGGGSKSFASLPAEAKRACHEDKDVLVGPNKRYKTLKDWEDAYAKMYYSGE